MSPLFSKSKLLFLLVGCIKVCSGKTCFRLGCRYLILDPFVETSKEKHTPVIYQIRTLLHDAYIERFLFRVFRADLFPLLHEEFTDQMVMDIVYVEHISTPKGHISGKKITRTVNQITLFSIHHLFTKTQELPISLHITLHLLFLKISALLGVMTSQHQVAATCSLAYGIVTQHRNTFQKEMKTADYSKPYPFEENII